MKPEEMIQQAVAKCQTLEEGDNEEADAPFG